MTRHLFVFLGTFLVGALIALVARTASHQPHADPVTTGGPRTPSAAVAPAPDHASHGAASAPSAKTAAPKPVNTVCAICGMAVDPSLPTIEYKGQTIGFGCKLCPPKFKAEPDKYGPLYLRNEVIKR